MGRRQLLPLVLLVQAQHFADDGGVIGGKWVTGATACSGAQAGRRTARGEVRCGTLWLAHKQAALKADAAQHRGSP